MYPVHRTTTTKIPAASFTSPEALEGTIFAAAITCRPRDREIYAIERLRIMATDETVSYSAEHYEAAIRGLLRAIGDCS